MKKYPNTSILSLITQTIDNKETIIFIYLKPVSDFYPYSNIHWYEGKGKDGKSVDLWPKLSIKQWVACGKDSEITLLFDDIVNSKKLIINKAEIPIFVPVFKLNLYNNNPFKNRGETIFDSLVIEDTNLIPQEFYQRENLKLLLGYKTGYDEIKPVFPLGFYEEDFIYDNLKKNIFGIKKYRTPYLTFHGIRKASEKGIGSNEMVGFYQQNFDDSSTYSALVKNEINLEIGKATIDRTTGFFKVKLSEPTQKGKVEILINDKEEKAIEYVLLQDIQFNMNMATTTFKDAYDRDFMISSDKKAIPASISDFTWQRNVYVNNKEADEKLSDKFKNLFDYLGPKILIADPYFINSIKQDDITKEYSLTHCQLAFINAMIHSAIEKNIQEVNILGYNSRANNHFDKNETLGTSKTEQRFESYEAIFKKYIISSKLQSFFPKSTILFRNAKEDFHNRYWFSITENEGVPILDKCVIITNSVGNINEVDIVPVSDDSQLKQITRKYTGLFKNSEIKLSI